MTERELTARQDLGAKGLGWRRRLPDVVVKRAEASGQRGRQWLDSLDGKIADLQALWQIEVGEVLSGGTHGLAAGAAGVDGARYVLKMDIPEAPEDSEFLRSGLIMRYAPGLRLLGSGWSVILCGVAAAAFGAWRYPAVEEVDHDDR